MLPADLFHIVRQDDFTEVLADEILRLKAQALHGIVDKDKPALGIDPVHNVGDHLHQDVEALLRLLKLTQFQIQFLIDHFQIGPGLHNTNYPSTIEY